MDRTYIKSQHIVERYLSGDLSVREARDFEKYCGDNPDILNSLPIPVRLKARMARKPGAEVSTEEFDPTATDTSIVAAGLDRNFDADDSDDAPASGSFKGLPRESRRWVVVFGVLFAISAVGAGALWVRLNAVEKQLLTTQRTAKAVQIQPPGGTQEQRAKPAASRKSASSIFIGSPASPQLIEMRVDMSESKYNTFLVTIDSVDGGRVMQIRRLARDSNKELRFALNTSAFPPGDYEVQFEGYTWRGDTYPSGWIKLGMR